MEAHSWQEDSWRADRASRLVKNQWSLSVSVMEGASKITQSLKQVPFTARLLQSTVFQHAYQRNSFKDKRLSDS